MSEHPHRRVRSRSGRVALIALVVLCAVAAIGVWEALLRPSTSAQADDPAPRKPIDAREQRKQILQEQKKTNAKLDDLLRLLRSGDVKVTVQPEEDKP